ncbi:MAG: TM0106 family RecB-like putative nuclease [Propionibacteriaceae bacterium]
MTVLLSAYAARSCPVKTQNAFDPTVASQTWQPDESLAELFDGGLEFEADVLRTWAASFPGTLVDLRPETEPDPDRRVETCLAAMRAGVDVILGGRLPVDVPGHRSGSPDALVRGTDQEDGTPRYHPVEVKWHKIIERRRLARGLTPTPPLLYTTLSRPRPTPAERLAGHGLRLGNREADFIQLAHYQRLLETAGFATPEVALAAVIGTDDVLGPPVLAWIDLSEPLVRTFSRTEADGWRLRSLMDRYRHEHDFRVDVALVAQSQTGHPDTDPHLLVRPIVTSECGRCPWWEHCLPQLDPDDVSLRIDKGPLDVREIAALRQHGVQTITDLANADLEALGESYLPEVTHRSGAASRLAIASRRARMLLSGEPFERETSGPIEVPGAELEIDFDIETAKDGRIYLWGFLVDEVATGAPPRYVEFSRFTDLDAEGEAELAAEALGWLAGLTAGPKSVRVYHYSAYEVAAIRALADRLRQPLFDQAASYAESEFVDLFEIVKAHFFGVAGLGLKMVASRAAGFRWRDEDPGGLNSQRWFADAVHETDVDARAAARQRVLDYNEDDVIATSRVRAWLRAC